jgi:soluble lytic murein transglycosylase
MPTIPRLLISGAFLAASACAQSPPAATSATPPPETEIALTAAPDETTRTQSAATAKSTATVAPTPQPTQPPQARIEAGERALRNGNYQAAINGYLAALQSTAEVETAHAAAHLGLATSYLRSGAIWAAAETLEEFIAAHPDADNIADARFLLGSANLTLGNKKAAINRFNEYLEDSPGVIDSYVLELIGDAHRGLAEYSTAAEDYQAALLADRGGNINFLLLDRAESLQAAGDIDGAISLFDLVDHSTQYAATRARMDYERAQARAAAGDYTAASSYYAHAVNTYPDSYYAYLSLVELLSYGTPVAEFQRGLVDYYAEQYTPAALAFRRYLDANPTHDARVHYYMALSYRAQENIPAAKTHLLEIIQTHPGDPLRVEAALELAYTQWGWDENYSGAIATLLNAVKSAPGHSTAPEALFDAGRVAERDADLQLAATLWGRVADEYPQSHLAPRAAFLSGISLYRQGEYSDSIPRFVQAGSFSHVDIDEIAAALLWTGKAHAQNGNENLAAEAWEAASTTDPHGYYGLRARELAAGAAPFSPKPVVDFESAGAPEAQGEAEAWLATRLGVPEHNLGRLSQGLAADARWRRGSTLWRLGLFEDARDELDSLRNAYQDDALASYQLALAYRDLGYYYGSIWAGRHCMDALGLSNPFNAPKFITHLRYGLYYLDLIEPVSAGYDLDPLLVYALIRQESLFQGQVTSSAYAQGLMQVIPPTGEYIARQLRWPAYDSADLYRPYVNVAFGAFYLDEQRDIFDGNLYAALVAYNAGPGNTSIWQRLAGDDYDLLVEIIRLKQPQDYVRRIAEHYAVYRHLYAAN